MDYEELLAVVLELIADTGRSVTFELLDATAADASKPWRGAGTPAVAASVTTPATFVPPAGSGLGGSFVSEELLKKADQVCLVAPSDTFDIATSTSIQDGGTRWRVEWVQALKPADVALLYAVGVKR